MKKHFPSKWLAVLALSVTVFQGAYAETIHTTLANLRNGPDKDSRILKVLHKGTEVSILQNQGQYAQVRINQTGATGWVYTPAQLWADVAPAVVPEPAVRSCVIQRRTDTDTPSSHSRCCVYGDRLRSLGRDCAVHP